MSIKYKRVTTNYQESLNSEKKKMIREASLQTLKKVYEKCREAGIPRDALIDAIETEIFRKTFNNNTMKIDHIYWLKKFVPKKKEDHHEQQPRT
jgi:beta-lactamase class A